MVKNILVLAPHTDDAEFGCGGSIAKWVREGHKVSVIAFSHDRDDLKEEMIRAMGDLKVTDYTIHNYPVRRFPDRRQDILEHLVTVEKKMSLDLVVVPASTDRHQDHQVIAQEAFRAFKRHSIIGYEMPWNTVTFTYTMFVKLTEDDVFAKALALDHYVSQRHRNYAKEEYIWSLAKVRGIQIGRELAEAFEVVRWVE